MVALFVGATIIMASRHRQGVSSSCPSVVAMHIRAGCGPMAALFAGVLMAMRRRPHPQRNDTCRLVAVRSIRADCTPMVAPFAGAMIIMAVHRRHRMNGSLPSVVAMNILVRCGLMVVPSAGETTTVAGHRCQRVSGLCRSVAVGIMRAGYCSMAARSAGGAMSMVEHRRRRMSGSRRSAVVGSIRADCGPMAAPSAGEMTGMVGHRPPRMSGSWRSAVAGSTRVGCGLMVSPYAGEMTGMVGHRHLRASASRWGRFSAKQEIHKEVEMVELRTPDVHEEIRSAPHVVILGAGASRAAVPNGDKNGKILPLVKELVEAVQLEDLLDGAGVDWRNRDFEEVYSDIIDQTLRDKIEDRMDMYFDSIVIPDCVTVYDKLLLGLRKKDWIATFNWDPLLLQAYARYPYPDSRPDFLLLHGNIRGGICRTHKRKGTLFSPCSECGRRLEQTKIFYLTHDKKYDDDDFIRGEWAEFERQMSRAAFVTVFGYAAPATDTEARNRMLKAWNENPYRNFAEFEIINIANHNEAVGPWKDFIVGSHFQHLTTFDQSYLAQHPRRSVEALYNHRGIGRVTKAKPTYQEVEMTEKLNCEDLEHEKALIVQMLCDSTLDHPLEIDHFTGLGMGKTKATATLKCLLDEGIVCVVPDDQRGLEQYELCNKAKTCEAMRSGNLWDLQEFADKQGGTLL